MTARYYIRENNLITRAVVYREYSSRTTATRAWRHLTEQAERLGTAISYTLVTLDASGAETGVEVY